MLLGVLGHVVTSLDALGVVVDLDLLVRHHVVLLHESARFSLDGTQSVGLFQGGFGVLLKLLELNSLLGGLDLLLGVLKLRPFLLASEEGVGVVLEGHSLRGGNEGSQNDAR